MLPSRSGIWPWAICHTGADHKLSTTLYRKPTECATLLHFYSNHSLKCEESLVFSQGLRYNLLIADDTILQKELETLTVSLLAWKCPLEIITHNISKALLYSRETLLYRTPRASSSRTVLPVVTLYPSEGRPFSKSVQDHWHIIENDPQLHSIWPNLCPLTPPPPPPHPSMPNTKQNPLRTF